MLSRSINFNKQELQRDLFNLSVISGLHTGLKLTTASMPDGKLSSSKVKVKVSSSIARSTITLVEDS